MFRNSLLRLGFVRMEKKGQSVMGVTKSIIGGVRYGTSHLKRHIEKCTKCRFDDVGQMMVDMQGKLKAKKIDQMVSRELCANLIIRHGLPFKFVEYPELRTWISYLNPEATLVSRNTIKKDILRIFDREKIKLKGELHNITSRICLTSDLWTSCTTEGYISLTAHYVDSNWKLRTKILNFCHFPPTHTGFELSKKINACLHDWEIEKRIFSITLDNASSNDVLVKTLKNQLVLNNSLVCSGEFFHVRCSTHILNLIVQEGLKVLGDALHQIRESIKYVRGSETGMIKFKECLQQIGNIDSSSGLCLDVPTRWNSTFFMLQSVVKYQRDSENLRLVDENYKYYPSEEAWKRAKKITVFLSPFYEITNLMSSSSYPTSNLYFFQVWKIQCLLMESVQDGDEVIRNMAEKMMVKFDKYWDEYNIVLAFGAILDPRMKLVTLGFFFEKVDPLCWEQKVEKIKDKMYILFSQYSSKTSTSNAQKCSMSDALSSSSTKPNLFDVSYLLSSNFIIIIVHTNILSFCLSC